MQIQKERFEAYSRPDSGTANQKHSGLNQEHSELNQEHSGLLLGGKNLLRFANILVYLREDLARTRSETLPSSSLLRRSLIDLEPDMKNLAGRLEDWQACVIFLLQRLSTHSDERINRFARVALKHMTRIHQYTEAPVSSPIH